MVLFLYNLALVLALVATTPWWLVRMATTHKYREGLLRRLGWVPRGLKSAAGSNARPVIWLHAVSVGEVLAVTRLVEALDTALPGYSVVISTTTSTGYKLARERFGAGRVFYCPLDLPWAVRAYLNALKPRMLILAETEFWPNLLSGCFRRGIPVAVVNARISDRSWPRYRRLRRLWRPFLSRLSGVLAQSETDAERLRAIGCREESVSVGGNLKFDIRAAREAKATVRLKSLGAGLGFVVAGSTLEGEEAALLAAWPRLLAADPQLALVVAPRHPERFAAVATLAGASGFPFSRRSEWRGAEVGPLAPGSIVLLDTLGELASVYSLAAVTFVGGSLVPAGGHNPLEPAQFGVPIVMGPHYVNFRAIVDELRAHDAIRIVPDGELASALLDLLSNSAAAAEMGVRGKEIFNCRAGATDRSVAVIVKLLSVQGEERMSRPSSARPWLLPLVPLYRLALGLRELRLRSGLEPVHRLRLPVIAIGNLSAGGAGKTPLTIALAQALTRRGIEVDVLSRGYGRAGKGAAGVDLGGTAEEFGDEPLVIARSAEVPVYVAASRYEAGLRAESQALKGNGFEPAPNFANESVSGAILKGHGFSRAENDRKGSGASAPEGRPSAVHLLDDGFQHRQLHRDLDILLLSCRDLEDRLLPAGNLREPLSAIHRAQVIAIPESEPELEGELKAMGWQGAVWHICRRMEVPPVAGPAVAFCGIARPGQFFEGLEAAGMLLAARIVFRDHHRYTARDLQGLQKAASNAQAAALITTEKDLVRLGALVESLPAALPVFTARLRIEIADEAAAINWLLARIGR
jgi:3-deoxy-D-manno-octulosonic-acid transferase